MKVLSVRQPWAWAIIHGGTVEEFERIRQAYRAQGFRDGYVIDTGADGRKLTKTEQVRMVGNSVSPPVAQALAFANWERVEVAA